MCQFCEPADGGNTVWTSCRIAFTAEAEGGLACTSLATFLSFKAWDNTTSLLPFSKESQTIIPFSMPRKTVVLGYLQEYEVLWKAFFDRGSAIQLWKATRIKHNPKLQEVLDKLRLLWKNPQLYVMSTSAVNCLIMRLFIHCRTAKSLATLYFYLLCILWTVNSITRTASELLLAHISYFLVVVGWGTRFVAVDSTRKPSGPQENRIGKPSRPFLQPMPTPATVSSDLLSRNRIQAVRQRSLLQLEPMIEAAPPRRMLQTRNPKSHPTTCITHPPQKTTASVTTQTFAARCNRNAFAPTATSLFPEAVSPRLKENRTSKMVSNPFPHTLSPHSSSAPQIQHTVQRQSERKHPIMEWCFRESKRFSPGFKFSFQFLLFAFPPSPFARAIPLSPAQLRKKPFTSLFKILSTKSFYHAWMFFFSFFFFPPPKIKRLDPIKLITY